MKRPIASGKRAAADFFDGSAPARADRRATAALAGLPARVDAVGQPNRAVGLGRGRLPARRLASGAWYEPGASALGVTPLPCHIAATRSRSVSKPTQYPRPRFRTRPARRQVSRRETRSRAAGVEDERRTESPARPSPPTVRRACGGDCGEHARLFGDRTRASTPTPASRRVGAMSGVCPLSRSSARLTSVNPESVAAACSRRSLAPDVRYSSHRAAGRWWTARCACPLQRAHHVSVARPSPSRRPTDIRIVEVDHQFEDFRYRAPYQFGGRSVDRVTLLNVNCRVRTRAGKEAWGFGSMTLGNAWAFPAASQDAGLGAMRALADELRTAHGGCDETRPSHRSVPRARARVPRAAAADVSARARAAGADPQALHARRRQRVRRRHPRRVRQGVRRELLRDLRPVVHEPAICPRDLGPEFKGEYLDRYVPSQPRATMPVFHSVGASDPLEAGDVATRIDDGCRTRSRSGSRATA